jgi:hypothetical protein
MVSMPHRSQRLHEMAGQLASLAAEASELDQYKLADHLTAAMAEAHAAAAALGGLTTNRRADEGIKPGDLSAANDV